MAIDYAKLDKRSSSQLPAQDSLHDSYLDIYLTREILSNYYEEDFSDLSRNP
jgi:hypothetical protein